MPFLAESVILGMIKKPQSSVPKCGVCGLYRHCNSPKMKVYGDGKKKILLVGEAPGKDEDNRGRPFVGYSGQFLKDNLLAVGVYMDRDCWLTNSIICRPAHNRTPTTNEIEYCRPNLTNTLKQLKPDVIIAIGQPALKSLIMGEWTEDIGTMTRWAGWRIPSRALNAWICPTYHPSYIQRQIHAAKGGTALPTVFQDQLKRAVKLKGKPYDAVPDEKDQVEVILNPDEAAKVLDYFRRKGGLIAFDYETNMLKPEDEKSQIFAASVCWRGKRTISFPFQGEKLIRSFKRLMTSDCPKIAQNLKFEDRWTRTQLGVQVKNWVWDTMVMAHLIDNRPRICSLSFQLYVNFGIGTYCSHISPFFENTRSYEVNRIKQIDLTQLLEYCGLDSYGTYILAVKQAKVLRTKIV